MISWKHSFRRLNEENEMAWKKKQALDDLLKAGRISQPTHDVFSSEIGEAIAEIERQQRTLLDKMKCTMVELTEQIRTLEMLLANFEIQHVTGEIEEEVYQHEINILSVGIETARHELDTVRDAVTQLSSCPQSAETDVVIEQSVAPQLAENVKVEEQLPPEPTVEPIQTKEPDSFQPEQKGTQEPTQDTGGQQSTEPAEAQNEEKQDA